MRASSSPPAVSGVSQRSVDCWLDQDFAGSYVSRGSIGFEPQYSLSSQMISSWSLAVKHLTRVHLSSGAVAELADISWLLAGGAHSKAHSGAYAGADHPDTHAFKGVMETSHKNITLFLCNNFVTASVATYPKIKFTTCLMWVYHHSLVLLTESTGGNKCNRFSRCMLMSNKYLSPQL